MGSAALRSRTSGIVTLGTLSVLGLLGAIACRPKARPTFEPEKPSEHAFVDLSASIPADQPANVRVPSGPFSATKPFSFADLTAEAGIDHQYENGEASNQYTILESLGGGAASLDFDHDGLLDILVASGGRILEIDIIGLTPKLYRQYEKWKFVDISHDVNLNSVDFYHHGIYPCDYDQDGWIDILLTGYGKLVLLKLQQGVRFEDVTERAVLAVTRPARHWSTVAVWADFNEDGFRDLFVGHYVDWQLANQPICSGYGPDVPRDICPPNRFAPLPGQFFYNNGDGTFSEMGGACGFLPMKALGAIAADCTGDGWLDIYVANDAIANHFYVNQADRTFREEAVQRGVAGGPFGEPEGSMGLATTQLYGAPGLAIAVTNYQGQWHGFYIDRGDGWFDYASARTGFAAPGTNHVGWGIVFQDWDRDSDRDAMITQGHVIRHPPSPQSLAQTTLLLENRSDFSQVDRWVAVSSDGYFAQAHRGRALLAADWDNDGAVDVLISHVGEPVRLLRNTTPPRGNWWGVDLRWYQGRDKTGWQLILDDDQGRRHRYTWVAGEGYLTSHDMRAVIGLGQASSVRQVTIRDDLGRSWELPSAYLATGQYHVWDYRSAQGRSFVGD